MAPWRVCVPEDKFDKPCKESSGRIADEQNPWMDISGVGDIKDILKVVLLVTDGSYADDA